VRSLTYSHQMRRLIFVMSSLIELELRTKAIIEMKFMLTLFLFAEIVSILCWLSRLLVNSSETDADSSHPSSTAVLLMSLILGLKRLSIRSLIEPTQKMMIDLELKNFWIIYLKPVCLSTRALRMPQKTSLMSWEEEITQHQLPI